MSYIKIKNYTKKLNSNIVLDKINLELEKGKIYGLAGKNGCGKTMLIRAICGLITSTEGEAIVDGVKVGNGIYPESVGLLIEHVTLFEYMSAYRNLIMLNSISKNKATDKEIKEWLERFGLHSEDKRPIKKYSLGMKQKVNLIQAFMNHPDLIVLDEPTNALDDSSVHLLTDIIKRTNTDIGTTFIIASHDRINLDGLCDEIVEMRDGKIVR